MKKILLTGSRGQLGCEIRCASARYSDLDIFFTDLDELNITDEGAVRSFFSDLNPDYIVNCAAYTAVDKAEDEPELCFRVNRDAVALLASEACKSNAKMIHISTDYVFDGKNHRPYTEDILPDPQNVYGRSKLDGENLLMQVCPQSMILRTSWLYSSFAANFVKTMIGLGRECDRLNVVLDQIASPTYAADLAEVILHIIDSGKFLPGLYHYANEGVASWYDLACRVQRLVGNTCLVIPIETKDYPTRALRPHYSVLNKEKIKSTYGIRIPHWEDALERCIRLMQEK